MKAFFSFLSIVAISFGVILAAPSAHADKTKVIAYVDTLAADAIKILESEKSDASKQASLERLFVKNVDVKWIARFVLGKHWRSMSDDQKKRYIDNYESFIVKNYTSKFSDYSGQSYKVKNARQQADGDYLVTMELIDPNGGASIMTDYRMRASGKSYKVVDIIVEGVSLITTQRTEFSSVISRKGVDFLIEALKKRTA